jgi:hypothetical protein
VRRHLAAVDRVLEAADELRKARAALSRQVSRPSLRIADAEPDADGVEGRE